MNAPLSRRDWLRAGGLLAASLANGPSHGVPSPGGPSPGAPATTFAREFVQQPPDTMPRLRARLLANENPYGIAPSARDALIKATQLGNRYAWMEFAQLKQLIAEAEGVKPENVLISAGSSDLLRATAAQYAKAGSIILSSAFTYNDLLERAADVGATVQAVPMTKTYQYDLAAIQARLAADRPAVKLVYVVNPNNPTGTVVPPAELDAFCRAVAPTAPVFIDEAYIDFLEGAERPRLAQLVAEGLNVILARTFSKIHGFAGLRLGYAIGRPDTLRALRQHTNGEFAVSITTLMAGIASYQDRAWQDQCRADNARARAFAQKALTELGYEVIPSQANFLLFPIRMKPRTFEQQMFAQGIGIQTREHDRQPFCRVSIGTMDEMALFVDSFKKVVGS